MGSGAGGTGGIAAGGFAATEFVAGEFAAGLFGAFGEGCGEFEAGVEAELDEAELFAGAVTGLGDAGFGAFAAAVSGSAAAASALESVFFSGSFFFATGEITIDTT